MSAHRGTHHWQTVEHRHYECQLCGVHMVHVERRHGATGDAKRYYVDERGLVRAAANNPLPCGASLADYGTSPLIERLAALTRGE